jgi:hypothetical protein
MAIHQCLFSLYQLLEKVIFRGLLKNAQMQGPRKPETQENINRSVLGGRTPQQACPVLDTGKDEPACR